MVPDKKTLKTFGYIWALILFIISYKFNMNVIFLTLSIVFLISSTLFPEIYVKTKIFQNWIKIGDFLGKINSKIIIFILFFFVFTPIGFILRLLGKDLLHKKLDKTVKSYFITRKTQAGPMINQF